MQRVDLTILGNAPIAKDIFKLTLFGDCSGITTSGQFINLLIKGFYLRRPLSVCDFDEKSVTVIYKTTGEGTKALSSMKSGEVINVLTGLGNGFDCSKSGNSPLLIGGGVGTPPMYHLAKELLLRGAKPTVILGFNNADEVFFKEEFQALNIPVIITTADGSVGIKGFVTHGIVGLSYSYYYACGPIPMLRAVYDCCNGHGQLSFEERMGCGFGACMGCSCQTKYGNKRICRDGPVLESGEIIW